MRVEISSRSTPYEFHSPHGRVLFCMEEALVSHERFDGRMSPAVKRVNFSRGDSVAVLLYADNTDEVVLVEQFRYPVYAGYHESERDGKGWILETVAGIKDARGPDVGRRELLEETGYALRGELEHLTTVYVSPGGTSERTELYLARVSKLEGIRRHAGLEAESEDIRPHIIAFGEALRMVADGRIVDSKTVIALYMLKERLDGRREASQSSPSQ
ncbi:MAG: NUDIX hydrolase [Gemmatimonadota bacterium]|nr:NUDIX hydrolase [Gemmatimonadota bacterium]